MANRLHRKNVIVTGGGLGIGRASALMFAAEGAKVAILDIDRAAGEATATLIGEAGGEGLFIHADVTDAESVQSAVDAAARQFGSITTVHNNAGGGTIADNSVEEAPLEEFWRAIRLDLFGTFLVSRFTVPHLKRAGGGSIINMASSAGLIGIPTISCYSSAKGGVIALTRAMAADFGPFGIRVNAIAPGMVLTERAMRIARQKAVGAEAVSKQVLGAGQPDDIAAMAVYLASDEARFTTGTIIPVDGGATTLRAH